ncbi:TPA: hypothetical protein DIU27_00875 [Candidatus Collierbacteria bacterium]|uniref:Metallo-beta-lactamase family protein n=1 Tax=Candidatus Collierbacteria bacterium GW2011_GWB2_44_22 TaxID=1618387 RepID=A0A0G1HVJ9_9BACT|nr:MAG: Metallo-beta-lactamase family protein [Candidatus Collierbacteria bacterium GW2011_GWA2_44_13]KKT50985.1 MAG: Metallo-beta-lactamase family protein [Candidatus Collierbacteria bacterium GW2011_GWB2_44_22]KKT61094.1 MAG: Metallo-beta-lactamase family protein [Candidatus Collierbacteria bacterium GW2011_GWD1_44_27]KKT68104.1 MAG: Metallo-beta-lactamase family protein [Microgenomates group bacterium GW2011_GWC1_44_37]KKT87642.1 MAG: Metallo-beta-lactamase family protein [Candidatus Collier
MEIICLKVGSMGTNCYLVSDEKTKEAIIIDPGEEGDFISTNILENKLIPKAILLTHGHFDHCLAALELKLNFNIPIYLHQEDLFLYQKAHKSSSFWSKHAHNSIVIPAKAGIHSIDSTFLPLPIDHFLVDNEVISFGQSSLKVIHTPGHTPGSVCLYSPGILLTGDTLFANGVGRTDLSYSSSTDLHQSLSHLRSEIQDQRSTLIYPGHEDYGIYSHIG